MSSDRPNPPARGPSLPWYSPRSWVWRLLTPVLVIGIFVGWIYWSMGGGPRETDRVRHPAGYSIVKPRGWLAKMQSTPSENARDSITLEPEKWLSLQPSIWVKRYLWPPDVQNLLENGYVEGEFQGHKAWLSQQKPKRLIVRMAVFREGDDWYQVGVRLPGLEGAKVEDWWQYPLTFHPAATTRPAATTTSASLSALGRR